MLENQVKRKIKVYLCVLFKLCLVNDSFYSDGED